MKKTLIGWLLDNKDVAYPGIYKPEGDNWIPCTITYSEDEWEDVEVVRMYCPECQTVMTKKEHEQNKCCKNAVELRGTYRRRKPEPARQNRGDFMTIEDFIKKATTGNHANDPNYVMCCKDAYELAQEIQGLLAEVERLTTIAAARLADQEAIERHVTKRVAREIMAEIDDLDTETDADLYLCGYIAANSLRYRIRKKYGVE